MSRAARRRRSIQFSLSGAFKPEWLEVRIVPAAIVDVSTGTALAAALSTATAGTGIDATTNLSIQSTMVIPTGVTVNGEGHTFSLDAPSAGFQVIAATQSAAGGFQINAGVQPVTMENINFIATVTVTQSVIYDLGATFNLANTTIDGVNVGGDNNPVDLQGGNVSCNNVQITGVTAEVPSVNVNGTQLANTETNVASSFQFTNFSITLSTAGLKSDTFNDDGVMSIEAGPNSPVTVDDGNFSNNTIYGSGTVGVSNTAGAQAVVFTNTTINDNTVLAASSVGDPYQGHGGAIFTTAGSVVNLSGSTTMTGNTDITGTNNMFGPGTVLGQTASQSTTTTTASPALPAVTIDLSHVHLRHVAVHPAKAGQAEEVDILEDAGAAKIRHTITEELVAQVAAEVLLTQDGHTTVQNVQPGQVVILIIPSNKAGIGNEIRAAFNN